MKKIGVLFLGILLLGFLSNVLLAVDADNIQDDLEEKIEKAEDASEKINEFTENDKWDYLSKEWKKVLLENKFVSSVNSFLSKINLVFIVLFGEDYNLSLVFLFVIIFWVFFLINFNVIFRDYSAFSGSIAGAIAFALTVVGAQFGFYRKFSEIVFKLIFYKEGIWGWIFIILFLIALGVIIALNKYFGKQVKLNREREFKEQEKIDREILHREATIWEKLGRVFRE